MGDKEQEIAYEIENQQAGRDINQAGRDIIIVPNLPVTAGSELKKANLEMLVNGGRLCIINRGPAEATNIEAFINGVPANNWDEFVKYELPFRKSLRSGQRTCKLWGHSRDSPRSMDYKITWNNEDGTPGETKETDFRLFEI